MDDNEFDKLVEIVNQISIDMYEIRNDISEMKGDIKNIKKNTLKMTEYIKKSV